MLNAVLGRPETDMTDRKRTPVCELLGIELPIVEAPLSADPRLPAAVSNAGGLGTLGLGWADDAGAVVHLHSTQATAVSCLPDVDQSNPIPPLTPYFVMRVGRRMPIIPYYRPGDPAMEPAIFKAAKDARAVLLANHGPVVAGRTLTDAVYAAEELEEAAKLFLMLRGQSPRLLSAPQVDDLFAAFG